MGSEDLLAGPHNFRELLRVENWVMGQRVSGDGQGYGRGGCIVSLNVLPKIEVKG